MGHAQTAVLLLSSFIVAVNSGYHQSRVLTSGSIGKLLDSIEYMALR